MFSQTIGKIVAFLTQNTVSFKQKWSEHWFLRKTPFLSSKIGKKIAVNSDPNIDPGL
jgi:hypothetical protein